jgi:hypothetical protein
MTPIEAAPMVRLGFLRWSIVAFVLLLPFGIHAIWDYVEIHRLETWIDVIRSRHEPVTSREMQADAPSNGDAAVAARLYRAAAVLAPIAGMTNRFGPSAQEQQAIEADAWPPNLVDSLRAEVENGAEPLALLDRANTLTFMGLESGTSYNYRHAELMTLEQLASARTRLFAVEGRGDQAIVALLAELRLRRVLDAAGAPSFSATRAANVRIVVNHSRPSADSLGRLAIALRDDDRDDRLRVLWLRTRSAILDGGRFLDVRVLDGGAVATSGGIGASLMRPHLLGVLNDRIGTLGALVDRASLPWPSRIDAPAASAYADSTNGRNFQMSDTWQALGIATDTALTRCARVVVAVERYRFEHHGLPDRAESLVPALLDSPPVDPFSGGTLRYVRAADGYMVYSVGPDRIDNGGPVAGGPQTVQVYPGTPARSGDIGIRISHR